jgi:hypothetical protein
MAKIRHRTWIWPKRGKEAQISQFRAKLLEKPIYALSKLEHRLNRSKRAF